jgi:xanthine dehydrogenase YagR molybdenum-binding subunit
MTETLPAGIGPQRRHGASIGQPLTRRDGLLKVTGEARYAADNHLLGMLHAALAVRASPAAV